MNVEINNAIVAWELADKQSRLAAQAEREARDRLILLAFPAPTEGTNNAEIGDGRVLKGKFVNTYKIDTKAGKDKLNAALALLPAAIRDALVKYKPEVSVSAYKALEPAHQKIANEVIVIAPSRPSIEIVTPKAV